MDAARTLDGLLGVLRGRLGRRPTAAARRAATSPTRGEVKKVVSQVEATGLRGVASELTIKVSAASGRTPRTSAASAANPRSWGIAGGSCRGMESATKSQSHWRGSTRACEHAVLAMPGSGQVSRRTQCTSTSSWQFVCL
jgi:hypothetical protein